VAIINKGSVMACDTPAALKRTLQRDAIFHLEVTPLGGTHPEIFKNIPGVRQWVHHPGDGTATLEFFLEEESVLSEVVMQLSSNGIRLQSLQKREPTLEDVFVDLVGRSMEEVESEGEA